MTEIEVDTGDGPRVHAFVVGVAHYPYVGKGRGIGPARRLLDDLGQVTVPEPSAREIAEWLLTVPRQPGDPPIGTVEVLISAPHPVKVRAPGGAAVEVENAVHDNFSAAFRRWLSRCETDRDNVAIFYFCGHGWRHGDQLLLLEDLGEDPELVLANSVDLGVIRARMHLTGPRLQAYFVDACREVPPDLALSGSRPKPLVDVPEPDGPLDVIDAPVFFSTAMGHPAFGDDGAVTPYTEGLIAALKGLGARRRGGQWVVTASSLAMCLPDILDWERVGEATQAVRIEGQWAGQGVLHSLAGAPLVPFRIGCEPPGAPLPERVTARAMIAPGVVSAVRVFEAGGGHLPAGLYEIDAGYPPDSRFTGDAIYRQIDTPNAILPFTIRPRFPDRS
ncbi:caspase family protein [Actinoplanes sp. NPDC049802]|uniref:caspase family protein n=1 Tax=Actinoplanes sp. NPDC049802 TaxID=3154742 RepID=UPI003411974E